MELASWLLFQVLFVHPFIDGNGCLSRLLWCYSLMLHGRLPFPLLPFPGVGKPYKKYIKCIQRDQDTFSPLNSPCRKIMAMTLISVYKTWQNFVSNLEYEYPEGHRRIISQL